MLSLTGNEKQILLYIAKNGPKNKYEITSKSGIDRYATIHETIKKFESSFIVEGKIEGKARTGLIKKSWHLTLLGFCLAIEYSAEEDYDKIINVWKNMDPTILCSWNLIMKTVGEKEAHRFIKFYKEGLNETISQSNTLLFSNLSKIIAQFLSDYKKSISILHIEGAWLKENQFLDDLMRNAESLGLKVNFENTHEVISQILRRNPTEQYQKLVKNKNKIIPYDDIINSFISYLEGMRSKVTLVKWIEFFKSKELLKSAYQIYTEEAKALAIQEVEWSNFLADRQ
jgi:hypothetical protein